MRLTNGKTTILNTNKQRGGFTLVELLAVMVILAIILAIAVPSISGIISSATKAAFEIDAKMILQQIEYKKIEDNSLDETSITESNIKNLLGISDSNYEVLQVSIESETPYIFIIGKNKWDGLKACGTITDMKVVNASDEEECLGSGSTIPNIAKTSVGNGYSLFLTQSGEVYVETMSKTYVPFSTYETTETKTSEVAHSLINTESLMVIIFSESNESEKRQQVENLAIKIIYGIYNYSGRFWEMLSDNEYMTDLYAQFENPEFIDQVLADSEFISFRDEILDIIFDTILNSNVPMPYYTSKLEITGVKDIYVSGTGTAFFIMEDGSLKAAGSWPGLGVESCGTGCTIPIKAREPILVPGLSNVKSVVSDDENIFVLTNGGQVYAWGDNFAEMLGTGLSGHIYEPTLVINLSNVKEIEVKFATRFALLDNGTVKGWGDTNEGAVPITGQGDIVKTPTLIPSLSDVKKIYSEEYFGEYSYALHNNGSITVWGNNEYGQLGLGHTDSITTPTPNPSLSNVKDIVLGNAHAIILKEDGSVYATGSNATGVFGMGEEGPVSTTTPILITDKTVSKIAGNNFHTAIIDESSDLYVVGINCSSEFGSELGNRVTSFTKIPSIPKAIDVIFDQNEFLQFRILYITNQGVITLGNIGDSSCIMSIL